jgi:hypothetical protein
MTDVKKAQNLRGMHWPLFAFRCGSPRIGILFSNLPGECGQGILLAGHIGIPRHTGKDLLFRKSPDIERIRIAVSLPIFDTLNP